MPKQNEIPNNIFDVIPSQSVGFASQNGKIHCTLISHFCLSSLEYGQVFKKTRIWEREKMRKAIERIECLDTLDTVRLKATH